MEQAVPVAIMKDKFDGTTVTVETPTFLPGRYPEGGGDARLDSSGVVGKPTLVARRYRPLETLHPRSGLPLWCA